MSWGTDFTTKIYLNREVYRSIYEIDDAISNIKESLQSNTEALIILAASNFKDIKDEDEDIIWGLRNRVKEIVESIREGEVRLYKLLLYKEGINDGTITFIYDNEPHLFPK